MTDPGGVPFPRSTLPAFRPPGGAPRAPATISRSGSNWGTLGSAERPRRIRIMPLMLGHASIQQTQRSLNVTDEDSGEPCR